MNTMTFSDGNSIKCAYYWKYILQFVQTMISMLYGIYRESTLIMLVLTRDIISTSYWGSLQSPGFQPRLTLMKKEQKTCQSVVFPFMMEFARSTSAAPQQPQLNTWEIIRLTNVKTLSVFVRLFYPLLWHHDTPVNWTNICRVSRLKQTIISTIWYGAENTKSIKYLFFNLYTNYFDLTKIYPRIEYNISFNF